MENIMATGSGESNVSILFLTEKDVQSLLSMKELIPLIERSLGSFSGGASGGVVQPVRSVVPVQEQGGFFSVMPAYSEQEGSLGAKLVSFYPINATKGIETHHAVIVLLQPQTGVPLALVEGKEITAMRTAAASAVAVKHLTPSPASVLCILGSGVQARSHVQAIREVMNVSQIRVWSRTQKNAEKFVDEVRQTFANVVLFDTAKEASTGADVVVTVTMATEPVLCGEWLKDGAVVCAVGACTAKWRELDDNLMKNALVTVDSKEAAVKESGDIVQSDAEVFCEIGELVNGSKVIPQDHGRRFLLFKSLGIAVEDVVTAEMIYRKYVGRSKD